jgi:uncharacterized protein YegL
MPDETYCHLTLVLDRSGSMHSLRSDMEPAIQQLLDAQAEQPGKLLIDVFTFDGQVEHPYEDAMRWRIRPPLLSPRGSTALLDAMGTVINTMGLKFASMAEARRPGTVIIAVVTDGMENSSHEFTQPQIKKMVEHQQSMYDWTFTFLGANMDAVSVGRGMGVPVAQSLTYDANSAGVSASFMAAASAMSTVRAGGVYAFSDTDRKNAHVNADLNAPQEEVVSAPVAKPKRFKRR